MKLDPKKKPKNVWTILFFVAVSKNVLFASKTERFSVFLFSALGAPFQGALKRLVWPFSGPKWAKNAENWIFPVLGAVLGETPTEQI